MPGYEVKWDCKNHNNTSYVIALDESEVIDFIHKKKDFEIIICIRETKYNCEAVEIGFYSWRKGFLS
tara:strand:+ start:348 stop:548 length:201 start_codon:yes stop_codon:yes gene_type:complete